jgi:hypothetical protein
MDLNGLLPNGGIEALASQLGIPPDQARRGAEALLPSVLGGMGDNAAGSTRTSMRSAAPGWHTTS